ADGRPVRGGSPAARRHDAGGGPIACEFYARRRRRVRHNPKMPVSLKDQVVLVIGASSGIGRETAVLFAREGARVVGSARRGDRLRGLQDQLSKEGHSLDISPADASSAAEMEQLAER